MSPGCAGMFSVPPPTVICWSWRTTFQPAPSDAPSKSSTKLPPPPPPIGSSGLKRIQSKSATGYVGAWSDSATGPIFGLVKLASDAGRPTWLNVVPSYE